MPKFVMTIEVEWNVMPEEDQIEQGVEPDDLCTVDEVYPYDIAECICEAILHDEEMFAGSNLFVNIEKVNLGKVE